MSGADDVGEHREEGELSDEDSLLDKMRDELLENHRLVTMTMTVTSKVVPSEKNNSEKVRFPSPVKQITDADAISSFGEGNPTLLEQRLPKSSITKSKKAPPKSLSRTGIRTTIQQWSTKPKSKNSDKKVDEQSPRNSSGSRRTPSPRRQSKLSRSPARRTRRDRSPIRERRRPSRPVNNDTYSKALAQYCSMKAEKRPSRERSRSRERRRSKSPREKRSTLRNSPPAQASCEPRVESPVQADEEDLSLLELRLRALQSAAVKMTVERTYTDSVDAPDITMETRKSERETSHKKSISPSPRQHTKSGYVLDYWASEEPDTIRAPSSPRGCSSEPAPPGTLTVLPPMTEAPQTAPPPSQMPVIGEELQNILKIEDQQEQLQEFITYVINANPAQDKTTQLLRLVDFAQSLCAGFGGVQTDDYEPIAMDLDSNLSSPAPSRDSMSETMTSHCVNPHSIPLPPPPPLPSEPAPPIPPPLATPPPPGTESPLLVDPSQSFITEQQPIRSLMGRVDVFGQLTSLTTRSDTDEPYSPPGCHDYSDDLYQPTPSKHPSTDRNQSSVADWASDFVLAAKNKAREEFVIGGATVTSHDEADDENQLRKLVLESLDARRRDKEYEETSRLTDGLLSLPEPPSLPWQPEAHQSNLHPGHPYDPRAVQSTFYHGSSYYGSSVPPVNLCVPRPYLPMYSSSYQYNNTAVLETSDPRANLVQIARTHVVPDDVIPDDVIPDQVLPEVEKSGDETLTSSRKRAKRRRRRPADFRRMMRRKEQRQANISAHSEQTVESVDSFKFGQGDSGTTIEELVKEKLSDRTSDEKQRSPLQAAGTVLESETSPQITERTIRLKTIPVKSVPREVKQASSPDSVKTEKKSECKASPLSVSESEKPVRKTTTARRSVMPVNPRMMRIDRTEKSKSGKGTVALVKKESGKRIASPMTIRVEDVPQHEPVVITLGYDSDTSDDERRRSASRSPRQKKVHRSVAKNGSPKSSTLAGVKNRSSALECVKAKSSSLDEFLRSMRKQVEESSGIAGISVRRSSERRNDDTALRPIRSEPTGLLKLGEKPGLDLEFRKRAAIMNRLGLKSPDTKWFPNNSNVGLKPKTKLINLKQKSVKSDTDLIQSSPTKTLPTSQARIDEAAKRILETLKSARAKSEQRTVESASTSISTSSDEHGKMKKSIAFCEEQLKKYRMSIARDELVLKEEKRRLDERKTHFIETMATVAKLREQLAASERVLTALDGQVKVGESKVKTMQSKINTKRKTSQTLVQRIGSIERFFDSKMKEKALKRKADWPISPISEKRKPETTSQETSQSRPSNRKSGLSALQTNLSRKLSEYKQLSVSKSRERLVSSDSFNHLIDADKIPLHVKDPELAVEKAADVTRKRRSVQDLDRSTLPQLDTTKLETGEKAERDETKVPPFKVTLPNTEKRATLNKILNERVRITVPVSMTTLPCCFPMTEVETHEIPYLKFEHQIKLRPRDPAVRPYDQYSSPLKAFRAYRLHRYYRTKEELSLYSASFSHALQHGRSLCRFEMNGTCNDQKCPWQHERDYTLSMKLVLQDLIAYCPKLAGCTQRTSPRQYPKLIGEYVDSFYNDHQEILTADQLCVLISSRVNDCRKVKHPHTTSLEARAWRPAISDRVSGLEAEVGRDSPPTDDVRRVWPRNPTDTRYFPPSDVTGGDMVDLEARVLEEPENVSLWLQLARRKLAADESSESAQENALNILSRGLERNRDCSELWLFYLDLYSSRGEHVVTLCEQAVTFTKDYHIWVKYLQLTKNYDSKRSLCDRIIKMLVDHETLRTETRSHYLLETVLYLVHITALTQTAAAAGKVLQNILASETTVCDLMSVTDLTLAWLCYTHLVTFHTLPPQLWTDPQLAKLADKTLFVIDWSVHTIKAKPPQPLNVLKRAMKALRHAPVHVRLVLERNMITYEIFNKTLNGKTLPWRLSDLPEEGRDQDGYWLLQAESTLKLCGVDDANKVLCEASTRLPHSASIYNYWASVCFKNDASRSLEVMEKFIMGLYDVSDNVHPQHSDPNFLYKCLLGLEFSMNIPKPALQSTIDEERLEREKVHVWLNYALLLHLQGEEQECVDVYETALSRLNRQEDVQIVWIRYLEFKKSVLTETTGHQLSDLVRRCLITSPCQYPLLHTHQSDCAHYTDFSFHNRVVDLYIQCLSHDNKMAAYQKLVEMMPDNVVLRERYISHLDETESVMAGLESSRALLYDSIATPLLARSALAHALKKGTSREVRRVLKKCVELMPYSSPYWKNYVLYEITSAGDETMISAVVQEAADLGIRLDEFVQTALR